MIEGELSKEIRGWKTRGLHVKVYRNTDRLQRFTTLRVQGEEAKEVAKATDTLQRMLGGEVVTNGDAALWSNAITRNGVQLQALKQIQREHGIVLRRNEAKRRLDFFGPPKKYLSVQRELIRLIESGQLAEDNNKAARIADGDWNCTICWTEAENPVLTGCNHLYCLDCFEDLCMSNGSTEEFVIRCQGESGNCKRAFPLQELQEHLSSAAFKGVLEASFASHIRRHPTKFRYCPTPDCGYVYRASADARMITYPKCLETVCVACHERHGLLTCAEFLGGARAFRAYKRKRGIKDCPNCTTPIEKVEGCTI